MKTKKPMPLSRDLDQLFRKLYVQWRIPRGQYKKHPDYLEEFTKLWNNLSGRSDSSIDVLHYMDTQQKITARLEEPWPTFDGAHKRLEPVAEVITDERAMAVRHIYAVHILPLEIGTDGLTYRSDLVDMLAREFTTLTGLRVPGMLLAAWIEGERKAGRWFTLRDQGFSDLDKLVN